MQCISPQNLEYVALSVRKLWRGSQICKFRSGDHDHAHFRGQFVVHWLAHAMVNVCTKYLVSTFGHSKDIKGVPKFRKWSRDLSHAPLGVNSSSRNKGLHALHYHTKFGAYIYPEHIRSRTVDAITHARFQVNRFRRFGATGGRK